MHEVRQLLECAQGHMQTGRLRDAEALYQQILVSDPNNPQGHYGLGLIYHHRGALEQAATHYQHAIRVKPDFIEAQCNLGAALHSLGWLPQAIEVYRKFLSIEPRNVQIHYNLGAALQATGDLAQACQAYRQVLELKPDHIETYYNLALALQGLSQFDEAIARCRQALALNPDIPHIHNCLGLALKATGQIDAALEHLKKSVQLNPNNLETVSNLATLLMNCDRFEQAIEYFEHVVARQPDNAKVLFNLGVALKATGKFSDAIRHFRRARTLEPDNAKLHAELYHTCQVVCDWSTDEADLDRLLRLNEQALSRGEISPINPFDALALPLTPAMHQAIARSFAKSVEKTVSGHKPLPLPPPNTSGNRLRIGYLSPNFCNHAELHLMAGVYECHDREKFKIFAYSLGQDDRSPYRQRAARGVDRFIDLAGRSFVDSARCINDDGIHILVDLAGFTKHTRPEILALRPAPIQVNYLGYPGTLGADFVDYLITDHIVTPPDQQPYYNETFVYLPDAYQANDRLHDVPEIFPRKSDCGLPEEAFVFCCFNGTHKIDPSIFDVWMRILKQVPDSVLWLLRGAPEVETNLRVEAERRGITGERLFFAPKLPRLEHLARHHRVDLFLDTRYYNAHTTASDALRMGVPLVTTPGAAFAARVGASLLHAVGLPELVAPNLTEYESLAVRLASERDLRHRIRDKLLAGLPGCSLFDTGSFVGHLEQAYQMMWQAYVKGQRPRIIDGTK